MQSLIRIDNLSKCCGKLPVLSDVSLEIYPGECLGIFGRSGAGKTVLLRLLAGAESADSGKISTDNQQVFLTPQLPSGDEDVTPADSLWLYGALYGIPRKKRNAAIREIMEELAIGSEYDRAVRELPTGIQKMLEIANVLLTPAGVLLLDEPMADLDSPMRTRLWEYLLKIRARDKRAIVVATSSPEDGEICDRVVMLHNGRVLASGSMAELRQMTGKDVIVLEPCRDRASKSLEDALSGFVVQVQDGTLVVRMDDDRGIAEILEQVRSDVVAVYIRPQNLDSILEQLI